MHSTEFTKWFRACTPYIRSHQGKTFVITLPPECLESDNIRNIVHDLALLHVLGVRIAIIFGDSATTEQVVNDAKLQEIEQRTNQVRSQIELLFSAGIPESNLRERHIPIVSGNLVTAKPIGVIDGIDYVRAGKVRNIHAHQITSLLNGMNLVLIPPIGLSAAGAAYYLDGYHLAVEVAVALAADKLIILDANAQIKDGEGNGLSDIRIEILETLISSKGTAHNNDSILRCLLESAQRGVPRTHAISYLQDGALLQELFTPDGVGTQISEDDYRTIRQAKVTDMAAIVELIRPFEQNGSIVSRSKDQLENEIDSYWVAELDGLIIGCAAMYEFEDGYFELGCLVTAESYRSKALGRRLLLAVEQSAREANAVSLFALTTQATEWFIENGFAIGEIDDLPSTRVKSYDAQRNSKVLLKSLS